MRLLALAEVYDGWQRTDASRIGGVGLQITSRLPQVLRFNLLPAATGGLVDVLRAVNGRTLALNAGTVNSAHWRIVEAGPVPAVDGVVRWRRKDRARWLLETFAIGSTRPTVGRELKALGFAIDLGAAAPLRAKRAGRRGF